MGRGFCYIFEQVLLMIARKLINKAVNQNGVTTVHQTMYLLLVRPAKFTFVIV